MLNKLVNSRQNKCEINLAQVYFEAGEVKKAKVKR